MFLAAGYLLSWEGHRAGRGLTRRPAARPRWALLVRGCSCSGSRAVPLTLPVPLQTSPECRTSRRRSRVATGSLWLQRAKGAPPPSGAPRKNTAKDADFGDCNLPMAREHSKELLTPCQLLGSSDPGAPGSWRAWATGPLLASGSYTTDATFSCLLPSTLGKFIYLLFISYTGSGAI